MLDEIALSVFTIVEGNVTPVTDLEQSDFEFVTVGDPPGPAVNFSGFTDQGNGNYVCSQFNVSELTPVWVKIQGTIRYAYGAFYVGPPDSSFLMRDGSNTMDANLDLDNHKIINLADGSASGDAVNKSQLDTKLSLIGGTMAGNLNMGSKRITNLSDATDNDNAVNLSQVNTILDDYLPLSGGTMEGDINMNSGKYITQEDPIDDGHLANKRYVDGLVASIVIAPFQESPNLVRIIPAGAQETGKVYTTVAAGIAYFTSPTANKPCAIKIIGTGNLSQFIQLSHNHLRNYVNILGVGKHINLLLGQSGASVTKTVNFENLSIWMGAGDITEDRSYNSCNFFNCDIYAFKNLTFNNCILQNCTIYQISGLHVVLNNYRMVNCALTQELQADSGSLANVTDNFEPSFTTGDPTVP